MTPRSVNDPAHIRIVHVVTVLVFLLSAAAQSAFSQTSPQTFRVLYTFTGGTDGALPYAGVLRDRKGNLYGTTIAGGDAAVCNCGVVFELSPEGAEQVLFTFTGDQDGGGPDGSWPAGDLAADKEGNIYGATTGGGQFAGVVFKLDRNRNETVLHTFNGNDGAYPLGVIRDSAGTLFGVADLGNAKCGCGTVYALNSSGRELGVYAFTGGNDGANPTGDLVRDSHGNLYGAASGGGKLRNGVVFKVSRTGKETVLHNFNGSDGASPYSGLLFDGQGNAYGTTYVGGASNSGVVYKLSKNGEFKVLYNFTGGADGGFPLAGLVQDPAGNLYGTTFNGGDVSCVFIQQQPGCGVVFKLDPNGTETVLHTFENGADGSLPEAKLTMDAEGNLYGTAILSDNFFGFGVVFEMTP
jgi:uncharacterized repeat protein (TIGR03803 family)